MRPPNWTREQDAVLIRARELGHTSQQIAAELGVSRNAVIGRARRLRARGLPPSKARTGRLPFGDRYDAAIRAGRVAGKSGRAMAIEFGISYGFVQRRMIKLGLPAAPRQDVMGLPQQQLEVFRLYRRKGFDRAEALAAALQVAA